MTARPSERGSGDQPTRRLPAWLVGSGVIAVAMGVMNLSTYGFTILAARLLGPEEYGALAALMGVLLVVNVASLGLQATGARRVSAAADHLEETEADLLSATLRTALLLGGLCLLAVPLVSSALRLDTWLSAVMLAVTAVPLTVMGGQAGILQGERRWPALAGIYLGLGLGRLGFGTLMLLLTRDTFGAMMGVAAGAFVPTIVGAAALRRRARDAGATHHRLRLRLPGALSGRLLRELFHNSHALLAFFALSNVDVVIARIVLDERDAGLYAGGLILAKAVLFLPQFVIVVAFPTMSAGKGGARMTWRALGVVVGIGAVGVTLVWLWESLAVQFIGGSAYEDLAPTLWLFACVGTVWAATQLLVYDVVARQRTQAVVVVWVALATVAGLGLLMTTVEGLLGVVLGVEGVLLLALATVAAVRGVRHAT